MEFKEKLIEDGICDAESAPSVSSINRIVRNKAQQCLAAHHQAIGGGHGQRNINNNFDLKLLQTPDKKQQQQTSNVGGGPIRTTMNNRKHLQQRMANTGPNQQKKTIEEIKKGYETKAKTADVKDFGSEEEGLNNQQQSSLAYQHV